VQVTQFFAPNNGGDQVFPRKERVRVWKPAEKTIVGIGGGQLKFKGWNRGMSKHFLRSASLASALAEADDTLQGHPLSSAGSSRPIARPRNCNEH
jgi:hypothetical protein